MVRRARVRRRGVERHHDPTTNNEFAQVGATNGPTPSEPESPSLDALDGSHRRPLASHHVPPLSSLRAIADRRLADVCCHPGASRLRRLRSCRSDGRDVERGDLVERFEQQRRRHVEQLEQRYRRRRGEQREQRCRRRERERIEQHIERVERIRRSRGRRRIRWSGGLRRQRRSDGDRRRGGVPRLPT